MMYKKQKSISDYQANDNFTDVFVVRFTKELKQTSRGSWYFEVKIQDANGDAMMKYWGSSNLDAVEEVYNSIKPDSVIFVEGRVSEYNGKIDFSVNEGKLIVLKEGEYDISDFIRKSEKDPEIFIEELKKSEEEGMLIRAIKEELSD